MPVDLSELKAGDTVHFRCGGSAVVNTSEFNDHDFTITFRPVDRTAKFERDGAWNYSRDPHPFDIIRIEPKPFDWKDAKPGMAFLYDGDTVYFLAHDWEKDNFVVVAGRECEEIGGCEKTYLTRAPEHDITPEKENPNAN